MTSRIPSLKKRILEKRRKFESALSDLPKSFQDNPQAELLALFDVFLKEIDQYSNGKPIYDDSQRSFLHDAFPYYGLLKEEINGTRPDFHILSEGNVQTVSVPAMVTAESHGFPAPPPKGIAISLDEVKKLIDEKSLWDLPGIVPSQIYTHFINLFVCEWETICLNCFHEAEKALNSHTMLLCNKYFSRFQSSSLLFSVSYSSKISKPS